MILQQLLVFLEGHKLNLSIGDRTEYGTLWRQGNIFVLVPDGDAVRPILFDSAEIDDFGFFIELGDSIPFLQLVRGV